MTLVLKHGEIAGLLTADEVREAVLGGFVEQSEGEVQLPPRTTIDSRSGRGWLRLMPVIMNKSGIMGFKAMHSTPRVGVRYFVALYDLDSGELLVEMDADWLTSQRTAATAAVGVDILAARDATEAGVLGSSEQARAMLAAISRVRRLSRVKVYSPTPENRRRFAETMSATLGFEVVAVDTPQQALADVEVVLSIFRAGTAPLVAADWISPGAHICAASSIRPEARELQDDVWRKCAVVAVDDKAHVLESGDGRRAIVSGNVSEDRFVEIWEILNRSKPGRESPEDITLFKAVGTAVQDLALGAAIYRRAKEQGLGHDIGSFPRVRL